MKVGFLPGCSTTPTLVRTEENRMRNDSSNIIEICDHFQECFCFDSLFKFLGPPFIAGSSTHPSSRKL